MAFLTFEFSAPVGAIGGEDLRRWQIHVPTKIAGIRGKVAGIDKTAKTLMHPA